MALGCLKVAKSAKSNIVNPLRERERERERKRARQSSRLQNLGPESLSLKEKKQRRWYREISHRVSPNPTQVRDKKLLKAHINIGQKLTIRLSFLGVVHHCFDNFFAMLRIGEHLDCPMQIRRVLLLLDLFAEKQDASCQNIPLQQVEVLEWQWHHTSPYISRKSYISHQ